MNDEQLRRRLRRAFSVRPAPGMEGRALAARTGRRTVLTFSAPAMAAVAFALMALVGGAAVLVGERRASTAGQAAVVASASPTAPRAAATGDQTPVAVQPPSPGPSAVPSLSARPSPPPSHLGTDKMLNEASSGQSFQVQPGARFTVVLPGDGSQYHGYSQPASSSASVLRRDTTSTCSAAPGYFCADFIAVGPGSADLTASSDPACRQATPPCGAPSKLWRVSVTVN